METAKTASNHLPRIDILRAIAIWLVFNSHFVVWAYGHYAYQWDGLWYKWSDSPSVFSIILRAFFFNGSLGVGLFFVISGLCIRLSHLSKNTFSTLHFYWRRFWRIYPPYLLVLLTLLLISSSRDIGDILSHIFLVHNFSDKFVASINSPFWSLALEFQVYLLYPLLLLMHRRFGPWLTGAGLLVLSTACGIIGTESFRNSFHLPAWLSTAKQFPFVLWFTWYGGFLVANAIVARKTMSFYWGLVLMATIGLFFLCRFCRPLMPLGAPISGAMLALGTWGFLTWQTKPKLSVFGRALAVVGASSYTFYLIFDQLTSPCLEFVRKNLSFPNPWPDYVGYVFAILVIFAISYVSYRTVETQSIAFGRVCYKRWMARKKNETNAVREIA